MTSLSASGATTTVTSGTWKITLYDDSGNNETSDYTSYSFKFEDDGTLKATSGGTTHLGTWSISDDDDSPEDIDLNIFFAAPEKLEELTDDWDILEYTSSQIRLRDVSGGSGETDLLTFELI
ncbi:MAG TPA: hypothetical protein DHW15_00815 [Bacteroidetes bacterium]|nr:MAG: hypothetical protein ABR94_10530 [Sphingobacteriales bacterium BACL12 MAG-120802-bin5]KRP13994.1 MAG: hypothetical protein ABR95_08605 [Sphingobacteriales bacterium BACL12 MAG-120813-bin55]HCK20738.1 hypothetical protein [Bacteroidota bacterium]